MHCVVPRAALLSGQILRQQAEPNLESGWLHSSRDHTPALRSWTCLLPLDVQHLDLPEQKHTNALVMSHILQPENGVVLMESAKTTTTTDAERLIALATSLEPSVQVILDVGAQILELDNLEVAKTWLKMHDYGKEATVFVDDFDEICVVDRSGKIEMLRTSSYSSRLEDCLIFLDEAHTRGIDLQLPVHYRALVTLGASLSKDRLVQACMRLRRLGKGQSVVFCVQQEIQSKILDIVGKSDALSITTADVLVWSISETLKEIGRGMALWQVQGERFAHQEALWQRQKKPMSKQFAEKFLEQETQTIEERYRPRQAEGRTTHLHESSNERLRQIAQRCEDFDELDPNSSSLQEEQERELSPEMEHEREVERIKPAKPAQHNLHEDVERFAYQGLYDEQSEAYMPAFQALHDSTAAKVLKQSQVAGLDKDCRLLVTMDFKRTTTSRKKNFVSDIYQRPVQWVVVIGGRGRSPATPDSAERMLIISPFEANALYKRMEASQITSLHMYKARTNFGFAPLDDLMFHVVTAGSLPSIPRSLVVRLNLFAGQLYISSYDDYLEICKFLGLSAKAVTQEMADKGWEVDGTGFILRDGQGRVGGESGLEQSPVNFFKTLLSKIRKNGESIAKTHMGELLDGKLFQRSDFE